MSADQGQDIRDMAALQARVSDVLAQVARLEARVDALEHPVDPMERAAASLEAASAKVAGYDLRLTQSEVAARKRLTDVE